jgi:hypothetical protein
MLQDSNNCSEKCITGSLVVYPKIPAFMTLKKISVTLGSSAQNDMRDIRPSLTAWTVSISQIVNLKNTQKVFILTFGPNKMDIWHSPPRIATREAKLREDTSPKRNCDRRWVASFG